ncbi:CopD family protein [Gordonia crocea]|uniref:Copper resistance protein D domain-containing protein n=1 Tax=Gordonia crocea TaxID=589162 RepID=A0A7I9UVA8_9ACTN|nr:CopD family protein [Gordonia crocea]GED96883.1 hypothetical protein nbrc107697_09220 [Gordonia crocea]
MAKPVDTDPLRRVAALTAVVCLVVGAGVAVVLAGAAGPGAAVWVRTAALGASVLLVGLGTLEWLGASPSVRLIGGAAAVWLAAGIATVWLDTAERTGASPWRVTVGDFADAWSGRPADAIAVACAGAVLVWALGRLGERIVSPVLAVAGAAAVGLTAVAISGHATVHALGPVVVGAHALAAAWWCGALAALAVTVRGRAGWATALPRYSDFALWAVVVLAVTGVVAAVVNLGLGDGAGVSVLWDTGYGRVVLAKAAALVALIGLAAVHRRRWVPRAQSHRARADESLRRAAVEVAVMAVALGLAAGLAATAPGV